MNSWATSGIDLHLDRSGTRVRAGLERALRQAVQDGRLAPGSRLPSSRSLAADLGLARNTVADAYGQLVAEGWLVARQGSGTRVARPALPVSTEPRPRPAPAPGPHRPRYDLRPGTPDVAAFPRAAWLSAARRAIGDAPAKAFGYPDPRGHPELRTALAGYLARARGVRADPDRIVVCAGFTQGFDLLCRVLRERGADTMAMEAYGLPEPRTVAAGYGLRVRTLEIDGDGAVPGGLGRTSAVVLTPAHQFPIGAALAARRRTDLIAWAEATGGLVIEDDYDGEFRYDRQPVGALQALAPGRVVYAGTASKSLAPVLRLGWLVVPGYLVDDLVAAKRRADHGAGGLDQLALAEFIGCGAYDRQVRRRRLAYRRRRDRLMTALTRHAPWVRVTGIAAGMHALLELPTGVDEREVVACAARRDLALEGLASYRVAAGHGRPALVVGYGTPAEHVFTTALARLTASLDDIRGG